MHFKKRYGKKKYIKMTSYGRGTILVNKDKCTMIDRIINDLEKVLLIKDKEFDVTLIFEALSRLQNDMDKDQEDKLNELIIKIKEMNETE